MNEIQTTENINILDLSNKNIKDSDNIFEHLAKFPELEEVFKFILYNKRSRISDKKIILFYLFNLKTLRYIKI